MIGTIHNEFHVGSNHAELSNDQFVSGKIEMIFDVFLKVFNRFKIVVIGIVPNDDIRIGDDVFKETEAVIVGQRKFDGSIWSIHTGDFG